MTPPTDDDIASHREPAVTRNRRSKFVREVYRCGFLLTGVFTIAAFPFGAKTSISILAGTALSLLFFWTLEQMLRWLVEPRLKRRRWRIAALIIVKYAFVGCLLYQVVRRDWIRVGAFAFGLCIVYLSVVMALIVNRRERSV